MTIEVFCCWLGGVKEPDAIDEVPYHKDCLYDADDDIEADAYDDDENAEYANDDDGDAHAGDINDYDNVDDEVLVLVGPGLKLQLYHPQALCC